MLKLNREPAAVLRSKKRKLENSDLDEANIKDMESDLRIWHQLTSEDEDVPVRSMSTESVRSDDEEESEKETHNPGG